MCGEKTDHTRKNKISCVQAMQDRLRLENILTSWLQPDSPWLLDS